jgi:hypothetical protein
MLKSIKAVKTLSKNEQKQVTGGMCQEGGYPIWCGCLKRRVCPDLCTC